MTDEMRFPQPVAWHAVRLDGGLLGERQATNRDRTIPAVYHQTKITGRIDAWQRTSDHPPATHIFWDSDTAKWMEAAAYSVATHANPDFERQIDAVVHLIQGAQLPDGYANSHFSAVAPDKRWRNLRDEHELYCAGHLIEAAVTYAQATGKGALLDVLRRYADHIDGMFGRAEGQMRGYPGHPELELALVRLARATGERRYLDLAKYFVDARGQPPHYYDLEARARGEDPRDFWAKSYTYCQAHQPLRQQTTVTGHAVRAGYLYAGAADVALETGDAVLVDVLRGLWDDLTQHHLYVTGGIGATHTIEGFSFPDDLPDELAYSETCAAIALMYWAQRMFTLDPDSRYIDVLERALYNTVLSGISYDGSLFFQCNPLASYPNVSPYGQNSRMLTENYHRRVEWFDVACCPSNVARLLASVGAYVYATTATRLIVQLYTQSRARVEVGGQSVQIDQQTDYPWDGEVRMTLTLPQPARFELALRIPHWCRDFSVEVNGTVLAPTLQRGYVVIERDWRSGDSVLLSLTLPIERIAAHPRVRQFANCVALQRGAIIYCLEEADNGAALSNVALPYGARLSYQFDSDLFGGVGTITGDALRADPQAWGDHLYQPESVLEAKRDITRTSFTFKAIPYSFWANRQPGEMRVWLHKA